MTLRTTPPPNIQLKTTAQRRARIKPDMKSKLEFEYNKNPKPNKKDKHRMALDFEMTDENVHFWFQNRRARASRESKHQSSTPKSLQLSESYPSSLSTQLCRLNTPTLIESSSSNQNDNTSGSKPYLPHIFTLWEDSSPSKNALISMYEQSHTSFIPTYFYHSPFGIESSYLKWQAIEYVGHST